MSGVTVEEGNRRLLVLAEFLEKLPGERFDYSVWVGVDWQGKSDLSCGTSACALGWAATIPEFQHLGLRLARERGDTGAGFVCLGEPRKDMALYSQSMRAARELFNVTTLEAEYLFHPDHGDPNGSDEFSPPEDATASEVAAHIRRFVKGRS